jgi:hypothetical protein
LCVKWGKNIGVFWIYSNFMVNRQLSISWLTQKSYRYNHFLFLFLFLLDFYSGRRTSWKTMFWIVCFSWPGSLFTANFKLLGRLTLEQATYSWPCPKTGPLNQTPTRFRVWPCDKSILYLIC